MNKKNTGPDVEALAAQIGAHPDYRVLRRLDTSIEYPALCPSYVVTWQQLAAALDTACKATGAGHLGMAIEVMRKMAMGESR